jgi:hypothetical protein
MPYALARKYPNAEREWVWQWVFPQQNRWHDRESGIQGRHHLGIPSGSATLAFGQVRQHT